MPRSLNSDFPARLVVTLAIRGYLVMIEASSEVCKGFTKKESFNHLNLAVDNATRWNSLYKT